MTRVAEAVQVAKAELASRADATAAPAMAAYMKTDMPFYGVKSSGRKEVARRLFAEFAPADAAELWDLIDGLWTEPHREEKYLAVAYGRRFSRMLGAGDLPRIAALITEGAWWDLVDELAIHLVGDVLRRDPAGSWPVIDAWNRSPDMWLRRTSIICQVGSKSATDATRLFRFCLACAHEKEFFVRKAIGWALRQYARVDPTAVRTFLAEHGDALSGLSYREAAKHL